MKTPEIFVKRETPDTHGRWLARARLRVKNGELWLVWMEDRKCKTFYLGKRTRGFAEASNKFKTAKSVEQITSKFLFSEAIL